MDEKGFVDVIFGRHSTGEMFGWFVGSPGGAVHESFIDLEIYHGSIFGLASNPPSKRMSDLLDLVSRNSAVLSAADLSKRDSR